MTCCRLFTWIWESSSIFQHVCFRNYVRVRKLSAEAVESVISLVDFDTLGAAAALEPPSPEQLTDTCNQTFISKM